jgi:hypothetical protein
MVICNITEMQRHNWMSLIKTGTPSRYVFAVPTTAVAQLVEALRQKRGGRGLDSRPGLWSWAFGSPGIHSASNKNAYQNFLGTKVRLVDSFAVLFVSNVKGRVEAQDFTTPPPLRASTTCYGTALPLPIMDQTKALSLF